MKTIFILAVFFLYSYLTGYLATYLGGLWLGIPLVAFNVFIGYKIREDLLNE